MQPIGLEVGEWIFAMKNEHCSACTKAGNGRCTNGQKFLDLSCMLGDGNFEPIDVEEFIKRRRKKNG